MVVFTCKLDQLYGTPENLQRVIECRTLTRRYIHIGGTMQEQEWCVDLICIEKRAMLRIELWVIPRIAPSRCYRAVCNTPVASCPVARDRTNASVADGCSKNVGLRLQILRHEAPVACTTAPNFLQRSHAPQ